MEQNIGVATAVAKDVFIMTNGRITNVIDAKELGEDRALQQQLLGVGRMENTPVISVPVSTTKSILKSARIDAANKAPSVSARTASDRAATTLGARTMEAGQLFRTIGGKIRWGSAFCGR